MTVNVPEGLQDIRTLAQTTGKDHLIAQLQAMDRKYGGASLGLILVGAVADTLDGLDEEANREWFNSAPPEGVDLVVAVKLMLDTRDPAQVYAHLQEMEPKALAWLVLAAGIFLQVFRDHVEDTVASLLNTLGDDAA